MQNVLQPLKRNLNPEQATSAGSQGHLLSFFMSKSRWSLGARTLRSGLLALLVARSCYQKNNEHQQPWILCSIKVDALPAAMDPITNSLHDSLMFEDSASLQEPPEISQETACWAAVVCLYTKVHQLRRTKPIHLACANSALC